MIPSGASRNFELKVKCSEGELAAGDGTAETLRQTDTYFATNHGRLKLREIDSIASHRAELIAYTRPDEASARWSSYHVIPIAPRDAEGLKAGLAATLGATTVVKKVRRVVLIEQTRVHLDRVDGLGSFIELETVMSDGLTADAAQEQLRRIAALLGIADHPPIAGSYSDFLQPAPQIVPSS